MRVRSLECIRGALSGRHVATWRMRQSVPRQAVRPPGRSRPWAVLLVHAPSSWAGGPSLARGPAPAACVQRTCAPGPPQTPPKPAPSAAATPQVSHRHTDSPSSPPCRGAHEEQAAAAASMEVVLLPLVDCRACLCCLPLMWKQLRPQAPRAVMMPRYRRMGKACVRPRSACVRDPGTWRHVHACVLTCSRRTLRPSAREPSWNRLRAASTLPNRASIRAHAVYVDTMSGSALAAAWNRETAAP